jgi:hypothetical protein
MEDKLLLVKLILVKEIKGGPQPWRKKDYAVHVYMIKTVPFQDSFQFGSARSLVIMNLSQ